MLPIMVCTFYFDIDLDINWRKALRGALKLARPKARRNIKHNIR
jgi:hypothetical protein